MASSTHKLKVQFADSVWNVGALSLVSEVDYWTTNDILTTQDSYEGYETGLWNLQSVGASAACASGVPVPVLVYGFYL